MGTTFKSNNRIFKKRYDIVVVVVFVVVVVVVVVVEHLSKSKGIHMQECKVDCRAIFEILEICEGTTLVVGVHF